MQFIDLKAQYRALQTEINEQIQAVLEAGQYIGGAQVKELEQKLAEYVGRKHCITCANGTDALPASAPVPLPERRRCTDRLPKRLGSAR